jgi:small multidrug resistance pump
MRIDEGTLRWIFRIAAVYNLSWGAAMILFPNLIFQLCGLPPLNYPFVMSGLGLGVGLFGYGYWMVARDLRRNVHIAVIGFLGKTLGPIGWLWTVVTTGLPLRTMWTNVFNDLIWIPFFIIYFVWYRRQAAKNH